LGKYYRLENELVEGLSIFDAYTETGVGKKRLIGNVVLESELDGKKMKIAGFENHGGRTYLGAAKPLGRVLHGFGNNERDGVEGAVYKNCVGTYLHGPLLPKNPEIADFLLQKALERKTGGPVELAPLDDEAETAAKEYILKRFVKGK
jgi:CobQ-like glutamine amidotransferase family enzyme